MDKVSLVDWKSLGTLIVALIGAAAWIPNILGYFKKSEIRGKIISNYNNLRAIDGETQSIYLLKLSLFVANKTFHLRDIQVFIKFPSNKNELECKVWIWRRLSFTFDEYGVKKSLQLKIDNNEYLLLSAVLPKDQNVVGYLSFSVNYLKDEMFDYLRIIFRDYNDKDIVLKITKEEIEPNKLLFDDNIWE